MHHTTLKIARPGVIIKTRPVAVNIQAGSSAFTSDLFVNYIPGLVIRITMIIRRSNKKGILFLLIMAKLSI